MTNTEDNLRKEIEKLKNKRECFHKRELLKAELKGYQKAKAETNEQIELARASGYNEGCYVTKAETLKNCISNLRKYGFIDGHTDEDIKCLLEEQILKDLEMTG